MLKKFVRRIFNPPTINIQNMTENNSYAVEDKLLVELRTKYPKQIRAINNVLVSDRDISYRYFMILLVRFYRKVYNMPASEKNHHKEEYGLIVHTLETVVMALNAYTQELELHYNKKGSLDVQFNYMNSERALFAIAIKALIHDGGKIYDIDVTTENGDTFDATVENLYDFAEQHQSYRIAWKPGRAFQHDKRAILIFSELIREEDKRYMNSINFFRIVNDLLGFDSVSFIKEIVECADKQSSVAAISENPPPEKEINEITEDFMLRTSFCETVKWLNDNQLIAFNKMPYNALIAQGVTLLLYPDIVNRVIKNMKNKGVRTTAEHIVKLLANKDMILFSKDGNPVLEVSHKPDDGSSMLPTKKDKYIAIKHKYIWACSVPEQFKGLLIMNNVEEEEHIAVIKETIAAQRPLTQAERAVIKSAEEPHVAGCETIPSHVPTDKNYPDRAEAIIISDTQSAEMPVEESIGDKNYVSENYIGDEQKIPTEEGTEVCISEDVQNSMVTVAVTENTTKVESDIQREEPACGISGINSHETEQMCVKTKVFKGQPFLDALKVILDKGGSKDVFEAVIENTGTEVIVVMIPGGMLEVVVNIPFEQRHSEWTVYINSLDSKSFLYKTHKSPTCRKITLLRDNQQFDYKDALVILKQAAGLT